VWDGEISPVPLALFRVGIALLVLVRTTDWLRPFLQLDHYAWVRGLEYLTSVDRIKEPALRSPLWWFPALGVNATHVLVYARTALAVLVLVGVRPRWTAALLGIVGYALMAADRYRYLHHLHLLWISCFLLALAPSDERFSITSWLVAKPRRAFVSRWSIQLLRFQLLCIYVAAGAAKLTPDWLDGRLLRTFASAGLLRGATWDWAVHQLGYAGLAKGACAIELAIPVLLVVRRTRMAGVVLGLAFHLLMDRVMMLSIFPAQMALYLMLFLPWREVRGTPARSS
jgi:vitamin K-dependent gamma-carboxylase-like protein